MYKISFLRMFYKIYEIIYSEILLNKITSPLDVEGHDVIMVGDFNEVLAQVATECQLVDVMTAKHPGMTHPATFMRGRTRIDYVLASPRALQAVRYCGYEAFQHRVHSVLLYPGNPECHCDVTNDVTASQCQGHSINSS